jgi:Mn-containing catalase
MNGSNQKMVPRHRSKAFSDQDHDSEQEQERESNSAKEDSPVKGRSYRGKEEESVITTKQQQQQQQQLMRHASSFDDHLDALTLYCERST